MIDYLFDLVNSDEFDGLVRHSLSTVGGGLIASGALSTDQWQLISGGAVALVAVLWSFASKRFIKSQVAKAA